MLQILIITGALLAQSTYAETTTKWLTPDFAIIRTDQKRPAANFTTDCRAKIKTAVCLVNGQGDNNCQTGSENYAPTFEALYDRFPSHLQKMFCTLERIYILKQFYATAYAGLVEDYSNKTIGAEMGIRKDFVDQTFTIDLWASWKEQLNFGGDPDKYSMDPNLPQIHSSSQDMLYYVVTHEFGHMFDFANNLTGSGSWSELSWEYYDQPTPENDFPLRSSLCFYQCNGNFIQLAKAVDLYNGLFSTNFISIYAASNEMDDWAETLAYYTMNHELNGSYNISLADGTKFDVMNHMNSPLMSKKIAFLEKLFRDGPKYPGQ